MKARLKKLIKKSGVPVALALAGLVVTFIGGKEINPADIAALLAVVPDLVVAIW